MEAGDLAHRLGALAVELQHEADAESTLNSIVRGAVTLVPGARWAGISFIDGKRVVPRVPSDPIVEKLDTLQSDLDDGPCLDSLREHRTVHIADTATEQRWPRFGRAALEHGVRSTLSFQLFVVGSNIGALNLYATEPKAFDEESLNVGRIVASTPRSHWRRWPPRRSSTER
ncbi:GAF domain-containing protein [Mycobacterium sp. PS03-16]|uniref:GAF domain-containing protein n=1 Tax=Mycobacterium sp. PS03-16 TaxID=2559611 RepID=UPI001FD75160|nr:GAF domain-containing protein [Mycobacterium sp. PS03-16]